MLARLRLAWTRVRDSLWFLPGVLTLLAAALAVGLTEAERRGVLDGEVLRSWVFGGGVDGARGVLEAIAGGLITVTGVVFSVTIVALQLASSQFTPRVLRNFTADRGNQVVLGALIAIFTYTVLVLRTVTAGEEGEPAFVPRVAVTVAVLLALAAIGFLIFYINHSARSIQVATILDRVTRRSLDDVRRLFPERVGRGEPAPDPDPAPGETELVRAEAAGYLQAVDGRGLFRLGEGRRLVIEMVPEIGEFVLPGEPIARAWPAAAVDDGVRARIRRAFLLGAERTPDQDVEYGLLEISDIAVKALSPGINDPTTAVRCLDRLAEVLLELGTRAPPAPWRTAEGRVHYRARHLPFARAVEASLAPIRHFGAGNPVIAARLLETLGRLAARVPAGRRPVLAREAEAVLRDARARIRNAADRGAVEALAGRVLASVGAPAPGG